MILPKQLVWLEEEFLCCAAPGSSILACGRQVFPAAVKSVCLGIGFPSDIPSPLVKEEESDRI